MRNLLVDDPKLPGQGLRARGREPQLPQRRHPALPAAGRVPQRRGQEGVPADGHAAQQERLGRLQPTEALPAPGRASPLPVDPLDLREYFRMVERGERALPDLLSNVLIRRTRNHVLRWYGRDAETDEPLDPNASASTSGARRGPTCS